MSEYKNEEKYKKLFGYVNLVEPPKGLGVKILNFIEAREKRLAKIKSWAFGSTSIASFGFSVWAIVYLIQSFKQTGFWQYLSLAFSENGMMLTYWKEFSLSLVESLPVVSVVLFLTAVGFFVWSITKINFKKYAF
jgi:nitrate reductase NapE component